MRALKYVALFSEGSSLDEKVINSSILIQNNSIDYIVYNIPCVILVKPAQVQNTRYVYKHKKTQSLRQCFVGHDGCRTATESDATVIIYLHFNKQQMCPIDLLNEFNDSNTDLRKECTR